MLNKAECPSSHRKGIHDLFNVYMKKLSWQKKKWMGWHFMIDVTHLQPQQGRREGERGEKRATEFFDLNVLSTTVTTWRREGAREREGEGREKGEKRVIELWDFNVLSIAVISGWNEETRQRQSGRQGDRGDRLQTYCVILCSVKLKYVIHNVALSLQESEQTIRRILKLNNLQILHKSVVKIVWLP